MKKLRTTASLLQNCLLCAALFSCSDIEVEKPTVVEQKPVVDTVARKSIVADTGLDSALYYFQKQIDYKLKRDEAEIKYLRTGKDRYRVEGNRYVDSSHFYSQKLQRLAARR